jgi:3-hydroxyisobutyrate dehydrogenase-like beta-hydroxyacid dehydrogenase
LLSSQRCPRYDVKGKIMALQTIGLLSPGDMGHSVGKVLRDNGLRVITCLDGRSPRSRELASKAGIEDVPTLEDLVSQVDIFLSILVPARAVDVARQIASAMESTGSDLLYIDCNAIAPRTVREVADIITSAGGRIADIGIVGPPPRRPGTRFYISGPGAEEARELSDFGLDIRVIDDEIGQASGMKMCYGALTKGLQALGVELLVAAKVMGLEQTLADEQAGSMAEIRNWLEQSVPTMPPKAYRWVGEMEEIALTFEDIGLTPLILQGAADLYRFVETTPIGQETPENRDANRGLDGVIAALAETLQEKGAAKNAG